MDLFRDAHDFRVYRKLWVLAKTRFGLKVYRWTFMTNHIHLLLEQIRDAGLAEAMHFVQGRYARYFGRKYLWKGHVWESRYSNRLILDERYFLRCAFYIEDNPVKAGIVAKATEYRWSSAAFYSLGHRDLLTDKDPNGEIDSRVNNPSTEVKLHIGRRAVGRKDLLRKLSKNLGKNLLLANRRSIFGDLG